MKGENGRPLSWKLRLYTLAFERVEELRKQRDPQDILDHNFDDEWRGMTPTGQVSKCQTNHQRLEEWRVWKQLKNALDIKHQEMAYNATGTPDGKILGPAAEYILYLERWITARDNVAVLAEERFREEQEWAGVKRQRGLDEEDEEEIDVRKEEVEYFQGVAGKRVKAGEINYRGGGLLIWTKAKGLEEHDRKNPV